MLYAGLREMFPAAIRVFSLKSELLRYSTAISSIALRVSHFSHKPFCGLVVTGDGTAELI